MDGSASKPILVVDDSCPSCAGRDDAGSCPNCGGTGRLWVSGPRSLSDEGLRRLLGLDRRTPRDEAPPSAGAVELRAERAFFASIQKKLYQRYGDLVVVIRERTVVGVFADLRTAETEARIRFGRTPVLIERLGQSPRPLTNAAAPRRRDVERLRALRDALREALRRSRHGDDPEGEPEE